MTDVFVGAVLPGSRKVTRVTELGVREYLLNKSLSPDIYLFKANGIYADVVSIASIAERIEFYESLSLPKVYVFPVVRTTYWLAVPSAREYYKRYVKYSAPLPLIYAPENISPLDPIIARVYKGKRTYLMFEDYHYKYDPELIIKAREYLRSLKDFPYKKDSMIDELKLPSELREAVKLIADRFTPPLERMVKHSLKLVNAQFVSLEDMGAGRYRVTYLYKGIRDFIDIDDSLFCLNLGICVEGHDREFDLASGILVKHNRYDDY